MSLKELANHLCIEKNLYIWDESKGNVSKIYMIEDGGPSQRQEENKTRSYKGNNNKGNKKVKAVCWECNKLDHKKRDCNI